MGLNAYVSEKLMRQNEEDASRDAAQSELAKEAINSQKRDAETAPRNVTTLRRRQLYCQFYPGYCAP